MYAFRFICRYSSIESRKSIKILYRHVYLPLFDATWFLILKSFSFLWTYYHGLYLYVNLTGPLDNKLKPVPSKPAIFYLLKVTVLEKCRCSCSYIIIVTRVGSHLCLLRVAATGVFVLCFSSSPPVGRHTCQCACAVSKLSLIARGWWSAGIPLTPLTVPWYRMIALVKQARLWGSCVQYCQVWVYCTLCTHSVTHSLSPLNSTLLDSSHSLT